MARVLLLNPMNDWQAFIPYALLHLQTALEENGHEVRIIDFQLGSSAYKSFREALREEPDVLGISVYIGPGAEMARKASKTCREISPATVVVWGGILPSVHPEMVLEDRNVDYVVRFEGEESFVRLIDDLQRGERRPPVPNIGWREGDDVVLNPRAPLLDLAGTRPIRFDSVDNERYVIKTSGYFSCERAVTFFTSRGCPYSCAFCYNQYYNEGKWRFFPTEWVIEGIEKLVSTFKIDGLYFFDDNLFVNKAHVMEILEGLKEKGISLTWWAEIRIDQIAKMSIEDLRRFYSLGLRMLFIGAESGSDRLLKKMRKGFTTESILQANMMLAETKIQPLYSFIIGLPDETEAETLQTVDFAMGLVEANPYASIYHFNNFMLFPGTSVYEEADTESTEVSETLSSNTVYWATSPNRMRRYISYGSQFLRSDYFLADRSPLFRVLFKTMRAITRFRMRRRVFIPFLDMMMMSIYFRIEHAIQRGRLKWSVRV